MSHLLSSTTRCNFPPILLSVWHMFTHRSECLTNSNRTKENTTKYLQIGQSLPNYRDRVYRTIGTESTELSDQVYPTIGTESTELSGQSLPNYRDKVQPPVGAKEPGVDSALTGPPRGRAAVGWNRRPWQHTVRPGAPLLINQCHSGIKEKGNWLGRGSMPNTKSNYTKAWHHST